MDSKAVTLSRRELTVAQRYASGETYREIASALHIAPATVRNHLAAIYRKLGVRNKPGLIRALPERARDGLVLPQPEAHAQSARILQMLDEDAVPPGNAASIAVMPFANIGPAGEEHVAHGVTMDIHNNLTRFADMLVSGQGSCLALSRQTSDASEIASRLGVQYVIQGTVRTGENSVRVTVELVDGLTSKVLWSERFDRSWNDLLKVQSEVAGAIASNLSLRIVDEQYERRKTLPPDQRTTYDWVLRGNRNLEVGGKEQLSEARRCFDRALAVDPCSVVAYVGLSLVYGYECDQLLAEDYSESLEKHRRFAEKAVALDESDSRAHYAMVCALLLGGQFELADLHAVRAIELNPSEYHNICNRGYTLMSLGQLDESMACFEQSLRRNPLAPNNCLMALGLIEYLETNYAQSAMALSRMTASYIQKPSSLAAAYAQMGYTSLAQAAAEQCWHKARELPSCPAPRNKRAWQAFWRHVYPYLNQEAMDHMLDGIAKAGMPTP